MSHAKKIDLGMTAYDELFMTDEERQENKLPKIYDIPLSEIDDFPDHPFKVRDDEDMDNLIESIRERGVITPATVRKKQTADMKWYPDTGGSAPAKSSEWILCVARLWS